MRANYKKDCAGKLNDLLSGTAFFRMNINLVG